VAGLSGGVGFCNDFGELGDGFGDVGDGAGLGGLRLGFFGIDEHGVSGVVVLGGFFGIFQSALYDGLGLRLGLFCLGRLLRNPNDYLPGLGCCFFRV
jgi:hypothetical protein